MSGLTLLKNPWYDGFLELVGGCTQRLQLLAPFVKDPVIAEVVQRKRPEVRLSLVSSFDIRHFYKRVSDVGAFRRVLDAEGTVRNFQRLHSKVFVFDDRLAAITSANLTVAGLTSNYEYGVLIGEPVEVARIAHDVANLGDGEEISTVDQKALDDIELILQSAPPLPEPRLPQPRIGAAPQAGDELAAPFPGEPGAIRDSLKGWTLDVFDVIAELDRGVFSLDDVCLYEPILREKWPGNRFVRPQIRKQLQLLRNRGLIRFLGEAWYQKLWV